MNSLADQSMNQLSQSAASQPFSATAEADSGISQVKVKTQEITPPKATSNKTGSGLIQTLGQALSQTGP